MTPAARAQAAIEILDAWQTGTTGMDRVLTQWGRANRYAGSGDRAAIANLVYDVLRQMRMAAWATGTDTPAPGRSLMHGLLLLQDVDPETIFTGDRHAPAALSAAEKSAQATGDPPRAVQLNLPDWLDAMTRDIPDAALKALCARAPLDLRVNRLKATPDQAARALAAEDILTEPVPLAPDALRVTTHPRRVARSSAYVQGLVEIQDASSQAVAQFAQARPGEVVLDLCAGGGGKTLALAATMENQGRLIASDIAAQRLTDLPMRADRASADVEMLDPKHLDRLHRTCDLVLVDAPCSGLGAWRRNPDAKWRLTPERLAQLNQTQRTLIQQAAAYLAPGGRLIYATCSLLSCENADVVAAACTEYDKLHVTASRTFTPLDGGDGFYCAELRLDEMHH